MRKGRSLILSLMCQEAVFIVWSYLISILLGRTGRTHPKREEFCGGMELVGKQRRFLGLSPIKFGSFDHSQVSSNLFLCYLVHLKFIKLQANTYLKEIICLLYDGT